jgi:putative FmdB family regulatory protein
MPIYEYVCAKCGQKTEVIQGMNDPPPKECPHCGGKLKKAISAPAIQFKGSGFYITDYTSKAGRLSEKSEKSEKSETGESSEKGAKAEKAGASEKVEKSEKSEKKEKKTKKTTD